MSKDIGFAMNNVAQTVVSPINADATTKRGGGSSQLTFAGVIVSQKGKPFEVLRVTDANQTDVLGKPFHSSLGIHADGMRTLAEALKGGDGLVVRVVPATATFPAIKVTKPAEKLVFTNEAIAYSADLELGSGEFLALAIKDGAESANRSVSIESVDEKLYGKGMLKLMLKETQEAGGKATLEEWIVSFDPEAKDQMGATAYIETVLEQKSKYLSCVCDAATAKAELTAMAETAFTGASNGDLSAIKTSDYDAAITALRSTVLGFNYICGLSCYDDAVTKKLQDLSDARRISGYYDINPRLTHDQALKHKQSLNLACHRASYVHLPYAAKCPTYKNKCPWGASGIAFAAKALGVSKTSPTSGWHYTPAGVDRAVISRAGLTPLRGSGEPNFEEMYKARLNKLGVSENGALFIDDSLTSTPVENYLRFEQVVSVTDAISRDFVALANRIKHRPDDDTEKAIEDGMTAIFEGYETVGALVAPRDPEQDGESPWTFEIIQVEIDLWKVTWSICPTGSGRRLIGEPILVR